MLNKVYLTVFFFSTLFNFLAYANESKDSLKTINNYLANIKTIEANFTQTDLNGYKRSGLIYIKKPNKIRIEYNLPEKELILLNSDLIMDYNPDLDEANYINKDDFVLDLFLEKNFKIAEQSLIQDITVNNEIINLNFVMAKDKFKRIISLGFIKSPLKLKSMSIQQGDEKILINFTDLNLNKSLDSYLFNFNNKSFNTFTKR